MMTMTSTQVLITGAAHGIGRELAMILSSMGCKLALYDINGVQLNELGTVLRDDGDGSVTVEF